MMGNYHVRFLEGWGCGDMPLPTRHIPLPLREFAQQFRKVFKHPKQREYFEIILTGLIASENRTLAAVSAMNANLSFLLGEEQCNQNYHNNLLVHRDKHQAIWLTLLLCWSILLPSFSRRQQVWINSIHLDDRPVLAQL